MNAFGRGRRLALTGLGAVAIALAGSLARADAQAPPGPSGADLGAETRMLAPFALELTQNCPGASSLVGEDRGGWSRGPTQQASGDACDNLLDQRDPPPLGRSEERPSFDGLMPAPTRGRVR